MKCQFCERNVPALMFITVFSREGVKVCNDCYETISSHRKKPYSKVMDRLAQIEAGYQVNRKLARIN